MNEPAPPVAVDLRIPGQWSHPRELIERLPDGCRVTPEMLILPDGARIELGFMGADDQFSGIFRSSCRRPATGEELAAVDGYTVNALLSGEGGSMEAGISASTASWNESPCSIHNSFWKFALRSWTVASTSPGCPSASSTAR